jgi:hypothetical protein
MDDEPIGSYGNGIEKRFESIEQIASTVVVAQGRNVYRQRIYLAKGYKP